MFIVYVCELIYKKNYCNSKNYFIFVKKKLIVQRIDTGILLILVAAYNEVK